MPTVVSYAGAFHDPWALDSEEEFRRVLELIWDTVFKSIKLEYTDTIHTVVCALVSSFCIGQIIVSIHCGCRV